MICDAKYVKKRLTILCAIVLIALLTSGGITSEITLDWSGICPEPEGRTTRGYYLYKKPCKYFCSYQDPIDIGLTHSYTDSDVTPNTTYCYKISAYNHAGESKPSNTVCKSIEP